MKARKLTSLMLVLCLVMSLISVCFIGTVSAATVNSTAAGEKYVTVLDLTFEGTNNGGIAMRTSDEAYIENGMAVLRNDGASQGVIWIGKDGTVNAGEGKVVISKKTNCTTENTLKANLFKMKSATTYKVTVKYAFRGDCPEGVKLQYMAAIDPYLSANHGRSGTLDSNISATIDENDAVSGTPTAEATFGEWQEDTYIFTTENNLTNPYLGMRISHTSSAGDKAIALDSVKIEECVETYVFDYKNGDTPLAVTDIADNHYDLANFDGSKGKTAPSIDADGLHFRPFANNNIYYNKFEWNHNCVVFDPDVDYNGNNYIKFVANKAYIVTAKYKIVDLGGNTSVTLGISVNSGGVALSGNGSTTQEVAHGEHTATTADWQYLTGVIDADAVATFKNKNLMLIGRASNSKLAEILIESVTVTVMSKEADEVAIINTTATPYVYDVERLAKGTAIEGKNSIYNAVVDDYEKAYNMSYVDPKLEVVEIWTDDDTFAYAPNGASGSTADIKTATDAERGTVIEVSTHQSIASTSTICFNRFKPQKGKKYYISVDIKLISKNCSGSIAVERFYLASKAGIMMNNNKTAVTDDAVALTSIKATENWKTIGWVYEPTIEVTAGYDYLLLAIPHAAPTNAEEPAYVVQMDNFKVVEYTPVGADTAPNDAVNAASSIRGAAQTANGYQSAGLRFKATVDATTKASASEIGFIVAPSKAAVAYGAEWYAATGELTTGISAIKKACYVSGDKDVVYSTDGEGNCDYQMILTGLSTAEGKTAYNQQFAAVMYVVDANGVYTYYNLGETSYNQVMTAYGICGYDVPTN